MNNWIKAFAVGTVIVVILEVVVALAFVGWMGATDRLSMERLSRAQAIFTPTITQEEQAAEQAAAAAEVEAAAAQEEARLASAATGLTTLDQRLRTRSVSEDLLAEASARMRVEREAIERRLTTSEQIITRLRDELEAERERFAEFVDNQRAQQLDEDFKQAVAFYEQMQPKQAKTSFEQLIAMGQEDQVIDYLSAMQLRKAGAVIREFKAPEEVAIATQLLSRLRERGIDPLARGGAPSNNGGNG
ncbi:MAG: hypothetical protein AAGI54_05470 [Planctomycetota bacterium]